MGEQEAAKPIEVMDSEECKEITMESLEVTSQPANEVIGTEVIKPMLEDSSLPEGWKRTVTQRTEGATAGSWDVYIHGCGKRFRSKRELERYLTENNITDIKAEDIDFTVWGKGVKQPRTPRTPKFGKQTPIKTPKGHVKDEDKENKKCKKNIFLEKKEKKNKKEKKEKVKKIVQGKKSSDDSSDPVLLRFRFKAPTKRKRHESELSIDLEELENHPYTACSPSPKKKLKQESTAQGIEEKKQKKQKDPKGKKDKKEKPEKKEKKEKKENHEKKEKR